MLRLIGLLLVAGAGVGVIQSGRDILDLIVRFTQVAVETYTMTSIGKTVMVEQLTLGRRLAPGELAPLLRREIEAGGRDPALDVWESAYFLETRLFHGKAFARGGDEFVVCSAGPDRRWADEDDLYWMNFHDPQPRRSRSGPSGAQALEALAKRFDAFRIKAASLIRSGAK